MISRELMNKYPEVDWDVYKEQQGDTKNNQSISSNQQDDEQDKYYSDISLNPNKRKMVNTLFGSLPQLNNKNFSQYVTNPKSINELINAYAGGSGTKIIGELTPEIKSGIGKGLDYLNPEKSAQEFKEKLGPNNDIENTEELAKRMNFAKNSAKKEALIPKEKLMETESDSKILPDQRSGQELVKKVSHIFGEGEENFSPQQSSLITKELKNYYKTGDIDTLIEKGEDIFNHPGLNEKDTELLEKSIQLQKMKVGKYLKSNDVGKNYSIGLKELHNVYEKDPTLYNADKLKSAIGKEKRQLEKKVNKGTNTVTDDKRLDRLVRNEKNITDDMEDFLKKLPEEKRNLYSQFRTSWAKNIPKYETSGNTIRQLSKGEGKGLSKENINTSFKNPDQDVLNILKDIGPSGVNNVLLSKVLHISPKNPKELGQTILNLAHHGGYKDYISKDMLDFAENLVKRSDIKEKLKSAGTGLLGAAIGGEVFGPYGAVLGGTIPFMVKNREHIVKILSKRLKK